MPCSALKPKRRVKTGRAPILCSGCAIRSSCLLDLLLELLDERPLDDAELRDLLPARLPDDDRELRDDDDDREEPLRALLLDRCAMDVLPP